MNEISNLIQRSRFLVYVGSFWPLEVAASTAAPKEAKDAGDSGGLAAAENKFKITA